MLTEPLFDRDGVTLWCGDMRDVLPTLPDQSVDLVLTDPPFEVEAHTKRRRAKRGVVTDEPLPFPPMTTELRAFVSREFGRLARRWVLVFCQIEAAHIWRADLEAAGLRYMRTMIWCLSGGTKLYARTTFGDGLVGLKDLARLDPSTVKLWNGAQWTQVLAWRRNATPGTTIEIHLRSGERVNCTSEHIWPTERGNVPAGDLKVGDVLRYCQLPEPDVIEDPAGLPDEMIGWFIGLYLAEGSRSEGAIRFHGHEQETERRLARLREIAAYYGATCQVYRDGQGKAATITLHSAILAAVLEMYLAGKTASDKHLTPRCWRRSNAFLRALLDGYLEGDGYFDAKSNRWRLGFIRNYRLEESLRTICARLGISLRLKFANVPLNGKAHAIFRGEIRFDTSVQRTKNGEITAIRRSKGRQFWDVTVADEPHLFALASGLLTHNCKPDAQPQLSGDRPATGYEAILAMHTRGGSRWNGGGRAGVFICSVASRKKQTAHKTEKPLKLMRELVDLFSDPGELVLDPFAGSGTTLAAARSLHRQAIGIEIDPAYAAMAARRLQGAARDPRQIAMALEVAS